MALSPMTWRAWLNSIPLRAIYTAYSMALRKRYRQRDSGLMLMFEMVRLVLSNGPITTLRELLAAKAHLLAYTIPAAANQRYIITNGGYSYQLFCDVIRAKFPELADTTPEGDANKPLPPVYKLDSSKAEKDLGIKWRSMEECVVDTVNSLKELESKLA
jgi:nucleoside-diphosphate-sugar epimerase